MTWLMEKMEQSSQERRGLAPEGLLLAACQHWWFWAYADALLVLFGLYWLPRQSSADGDSGSQWEAPAVLRSRERRMRPGRAKQSPVAPWVETSLWIRQGPLLHLPSPPQELSDGAASSLGTGQRLRVPPEQHPQAPPARAPETTPGARRPPAQGTAGALPATRCCTPSSS